ncbi:Hypothetical predicted protein, partial [Paramuricea clavata]
QVYPPTNQSVIFVLPGSTERVKYSFVGNPARASLVWYFARRGGSQVEKLAVKFRTNELVIENSSLPGVAIETPATLVLKNINERYNGKYWFSVLVSGRVDDAEVEVFVL